MYGRSPNSVLDLVPLPAKGRVSDDAEAFAEHLKQFHEQVRTALERSNQKDCGSCRCTREGKGVWRRGLGDAPFIEEPNRRIKSFGLAEALAYSYVRDTRFYHLCAICILFLLALYLYTGNGNGIHCLQLHPNNTSFSVDPIDFSEAITVSCIVRGIGVPPTPFDPLRIRTSAIVSMATMCGAVILTMALCESRSFQKMKLLLMLI